MVIKMKNKSSSARVMLGCIIFVFVAMSGNGLYSSGYSMMLETFHVDMASMGNYSMIISITGILCSVSLTSLEKRLSLKTILYLDAGLFFVVALAAKFLGASIITLFLFLFALGATLIFGGHIAMSEIVSNWYITGRARKISVIFGCAMFGQAFYQFIGGRIYSQLGVLNSWVILHIVNGCILLFAAKFLIIATNPEDVQMKPVGYVQDEEMLQQEIQKTDNSVTGKLFKNPVFWLCLLGDLGLSGGVNYITTYATSIFTKGGLSLSTATTILSCATISAAVFSFLNGRMLEKFDVKNYLRILLGAVILANLMMIVYDKSHAFFVIVLVILFYGLGFSGAHAINIVSREIFSPEEAADANSKISGIAMVGGLIFLPVSGYLAQNVGFTAVYITVAVVAMISLISYQLAITVANNQSKEKMRADVSASNA